MTGLRDLQVGHATHLGMRSGVTVILPDRPAVAAVHVGGGAPASRETDLLRPGNLVEHIDAIVLAGGSAFGLAAAGGVMDWLAERGRGFPVGRVRVPIVPAAALFDLAGPNDRASLAGAHALYARLGREACDAAGPDFASGSVGAGTGATSADLKGGFGTASTSCSDGSQVAAFVAANPVGRATIGGSPHFRAALFERNGEFGGLGLPSSLPSDAAEIVIKGNAGPGESTTLAVIATDCRLTRDQALRLAVAGHDGLALAIFPTHTVLDGDTVFALSTRVQPPPKNARALVELCAAATAATARAVACAIYAARSLPGDVLPSWHQRSAAGLR